MRFFRQALCQWDCCSGKKRAWGHRGGHVRQVLSEGLPQARREAGKVIPGGRQEPTLRTPGSWLSCPQRTRSCFFCLSPECVLPCHAAECSKPHGRPARNLAQSSALTSASPSPPVSPVTGPVSPALSPLPWQHGPGGPSTRSCPISAFRALSPMVPSAGD